ncbi:MAG: hypothetical protein QOG51_560 [Verrucomicrobiota bacterium]
MKSLQSRRPVDRRPLRLAFLLVLAWGGTVAAAADATLEILGPAPGTRSTLVVGSDGNFYGTSYDGGSFGGGAIFRATPAGQVTILKSLPASTDTNRSSDGSNPAFRLVLGPDNVLYGSTTLGGTSTQPRRAAGDGIVFSITAAGEFRKIIDVPRGSELAFGFPEFGVIAPLTFGQDGSLYGSRAASIFKLSLSGNFTTLATLPPGQGHTGQFQDPAIAASRDGNFYGTANSSDHFGTDIAFRMDSSGTIAGLGRIEDVPSPSFSSPPAPLLEAANGDLYGLTYNTVFRVTKMGTRTTLHQFSGPDGSVPLDSLVQAIDGNFYGTTSRGGSTNPDGSTNGTVYRITPAGDFATLVLFDSVTGTVPTSALARGSDGCFYGTTSATGPTGTGTIFRLTVFPPKISAIVPYSNQSQSTLIIHGQFFGGASAVSVKGIPVTSFVIDSPTQITATVAQNQASGIVSVTTPLGSASLENGPGASSPVLNLSSRLTVFAGDDALFGGFIISGSESKKMLVRGMGPSLKKAGVANALEDPRLELHNQNGAIIASNDNWRTTQVGGAITADQVSDISATGLAPGDDREAALLVTLPAAAYTVVERGNNNMAGVGLVELYDLSSPSSTAKLANLSTRGSLLSGDDVLIAGFIVAQPKSASIIVRAIGPSLSKFDVSNPLPDPTIDLRDSNGLQIAFNNDWQDNQEQEITKTGLAPADRREAAIVTALAPGNYTAVVRGGSDNTGTGLVEVYDLSP